MNNLSLKICLVIVALFGATHSYSSEIKTTVKTTSVISEDKINAATLGQLVQALQSFHGKTIKVSGWIGSDYAPPYDLWTSDGVYVNLKLDDGRGTTKRAKTCNSDSPCRVTMDLDISIGNNYDFSCMDELCIGAVGYNVELND